MQMADPVSSNIDDFTRRDMTFGSKTKTVLISGTSGPAVIVMPEIFGPAPTLMRFCRWVRDAGFRVYCPAILGKPDASNEEKAPGPGTILSLCISRDFYLFAANRTSPVVEWLKELAHEAHRECGGPGVGVIGMCISGGFALAMAVDRVVMAPIVSQPGLPVMRHAAMQMSPDEWRAVGERIEKENLCVRGYRFAGDKLSRAERFETLRTKLGKGFIGTTLPDSAGNPTGLQPPHSVFTSCLIDEPGQPTRMAVDEVIGFFKERLAVPA
jgi:dienelactone hydrolase